MPKKNFIAINNTEKLLLRIFNDLKEQGYSYYQYDSKTTQKWQKTAREISRRGKGPIDCGLLFPPTTSRWRRIGMVVLPKHTEITTENGRKNTLFYLKKKIF